MHLFFIRVCSRMIHIHFLGATSWTHIWRHFGDYTCHFITYYVYYSHVWTLECSLRFLYTWHHLLGFLVGAFHLWRPFDGFMGGLAHLYPTPWMEGVYLHILLTLELGLITLPHRRVLFGSLGTCFMSLLGFDLFMRSLVLWREDLATF